MMACPCSLCSAGSRALTQPGWLRLSNGTDPDLLSQTVEAPPDLQREYLFMLERAQPKRRPKLICRDRVNQVGSWSPEGTLVLGLNDIRERAELLHHALVVHPRQGKWPRPVPGPNELEEFARRQILGHELGHELNLHDERKSPFDDHAEAAADYWAGWLEGQRRDGDKDLGAEFFAIIGCNRQGCSHPSSAKRAQAYRAGFAAGLAVADQAKASSAPPPPKSTEPSTGEIVVGVAATAAVAYGAVKLLEAILGGGKTYHANVGRYRDKRGRFA